MLPEPASITAIDIDLEAARFGGSQYPSVRFAAGTIASLPFKDGAFDVALCLEGLEHVYRSEAKAAIAEIWRTLAPGGLLIATVPLLKHGRHSGNPFHLFEYAEPSILGLLGTWFESEEQDVFWASDSPSLWFVGRRRAAPLEQTIDDDRADAVIERAKRWLDSVRVDEGFSYAPGKPKTVTATCMAVLLLEGAGALGAAGEAERSAWARYIQSIQAPGTGLFHDPSAGPAEDAQQAEYLDWYTTYLAIQALDALGASVPAPLRFTARFDQPDAVEEWLDGLEWRHAAMQGRRIMSLLAAIIQRVEREQDAGQTALYHRILDWLDRKQHPQTGLWGIAQGAPLAEALACAYQVLPFYEYVRRPVTAIHRIIERALDLQQDNGLFDAASDGGRFRDLAAVDVLTLALRHTKYRNGDIKLALVRAYWAAWNLQKEDGGFGAADTGPGDVWSTWTRLLTLATVAAQFPADAPACGWRFRRWPSLGYHRYGPELSAEERAVLPVWIRRAEAPAEAGQAAVTVVVTCYNLGIYLHEAVTSVFRQTLQPVRIILVDDGSTDPFTGFLLDLMPWSGVEVIRKRNEGVSIARNTAIETASTPYICCLDGDDRLQPQYLAKAVQVLNADPQAGFVSCHYRLFDCGEGTYRYNNCGLPNELVRNEVVCVSVFRKDAWRAAGGYSGELSGMEDWDLWIGILESGYQAAVIPEVLFDYRIRPQSKYSVTSRPENVRRLTGLIVRRHAALYQRYAADVIPLQARYFSELVEFDREQVGTRDRAAARLLKDLARERRISEERIESLEESKQWFLEQLHAAEEQKRACQTCAASTEQELANRIAELSAQVEQLNGLPRNCRGQEAEREKEAWAAQLKIAELTALVEKLQREAEDRHNSDRAAIRSGGGSPSLGGIVRGAAMACSMALGGRRRNLLFWAKALANAESRRLLREHYSNDYYLRRNPDVARSGIPGLLHYICAGDAENRNPSETFDSRFYRARYADVARSGVHPFLHYVLFGAREGRAGSRRSGHSASHRWVRFLPPERVKIDNRRPAGAPLVSVVIPCFNYGSCVEGAIQSVLKQTFPDYELIVIEGGSTDGVTPQRLRELEKAYPSVRFLFREERHLPGDNRNYGIRHARGRYVCYLDADDLLLPTYLETAVFLLERYGYDLVYPALRCFGDSDAVWAPEDASFPEIASENQVPIVALFRKAVWETAGDFRDWGIGSDHVHEDWDFWVRVLGHGFRAKAIREPLMLYRVHSASLSAGSRQRNGDEQQRRIIAAANSDLLAAPLRSPREATVIHPGANLGALPDPQPPTILLALPFISIGGAEKHFFMLVQGLVARGYRVVIVTTLVLPETVPSDNGLFDPLTPFVYHLPALFPDESCWPEFIRYLLRRYHTGAIVIAGCEFLYHLLPELHREFPRIRIIDQLFNDTGHIVNNRRYASLIDVNIVPSRLLANTLIQKHRAEPEKVVAIENGANIDVLEYGSRAEAFAAAGLPADSAEKFLVSFLGRLSEEKAPRAFVEIARRLASRKDIYFCIAGDGPERAAVLKAIASHRLQNSVFYAGLLRDVRPLLAASDVVVVPSTLDGMPQIVVEAQLFAKPVIASAVGSLPEMIEDGMTGYLCDADNIGAFCERIERLHASPELRSELGQRARATALARYDLSRMVDAYAEAFQEAPAREPGSPGKPPSVWARGHVPPQ